MRLFNLYRWITGTQASFLKQFGDNQNLIDKASFFWKNLEGLAGICLLIFIVLGVFMAFWYYKPFNEAPGRHYRPKYWFIFLMSTFILTAGITLGVEYIAVKPSVPGAVELEIMVAIANGLYGVLVYSAVSVIWCNCLPTNAYKLLKF